MKSVEKKNIENEIIKLSKVLLNADFKLDEIQNELYTTNFITQKTVFVTIIVLLIGCLYQTEVFNYLLGIRCVVKNNYFVWEGTRPLSDCQFCLNVSSPIILPNVTREEFAQYAYTSKPVVIKKAFLHWPAMKHFDFKFFKNLYDSIEGSYQSVDEECQFLHFRSNFISIQDVFAMSDARIKHEPGEKSWYVGW